MIETGEAALDIVINLVVSYLIFPLFAMCIWNWFLVEPLHLPPMAWLQAIAIRVLIEFLFPLKLDND